MPTPNQWSIDRPTSLLARRSSTEHSLRQNTESYRNYFPRISVLEARREEINFDPGRMTTDGRLPLARVRFEDWKSIAKSQIRKNGNDSVRPNYPCFATPIVNGGFGPRLSCATRWEAWPCRAVSDSGVRRQRKKPSRSRCSPSKCAGRVRRRRAPRRSTAGNSRPAS